MRFSRSVVALVASTAAVSAIVLSVYAQTGSTKSEQAWSPERLQAWVVEEFQHEPDVAALIREVVATYGDLYDAWKGAKGEGDPAVKAVEDRQSELMARYFALWDARRDEIRRRAPAEATTREESNPLVLEARVQGLFKADSSVRDLVRAINSVDREIDQHEAAGRDRGDPAFRAALELRSELTAEYDALWRARSGEIRRRLLANDGEGAPADLESRISGEFEMDRDTQLMNWKLNEADREAREARKAGRGRDDPDLKAAEQRQAEARANYNAAWFDRYDEFRRRVLAGTDAFASRQVDVSDLFNRAPDVVALDEETSRTDREIARLSPAIPNLRDDAARKPWEQRKAALSARRNALWRERYGALYKQAVAELQARFTPKPEAPPAVVARGEAQATKGGRPPAKGAFMPGGPEPYYFTPIPKTIAVHVSGVARDERDGPIAGASVTLYAVADDGEQLVVSRFLAADEGPKAKPAATTTTDAEGRYDFQGVQLPVLSSIRSGASYSLPPLIRFLVSAEAPGKGLAWGQTLSMWQYNPQNMEANGGEGHLFLRTAVTIDLKLSAAAVLQGKVVDEKGEPIPGATVGVVDFAGFDGGETNEVQRFETRSLPDGVGRCRAGADGGFRIEGLAEGACYSLVVTRPGSPRTELKLYAATLEGPDQAHQPPFSTHGGRGKHEARTNPITITLPELRPIEVHVAAKDDGRPVAGARLKLTGEASPLMYVATGESDAEGKLLLNAPPGQPGFLASKPPAGSRFLETYLHSLKIDPGEAPFALEVPQEVGAELFIEAVEAGTGKPMADVFFGWTAEAPVVEQPRTAHDVSSVLPRAWTNEKGVLHVTVASQPGRRYRFHFGAMREPVTSSFEAGRPRTYGYEASPAQSEPVELVAGKPARLRFELRNGPPDPNPQRQLQLQRQVAPAPAPRRAGPPRVTSR